MFKNLRIGAKLGLGFGVILLLFVVSVVFTYESFEHARLDLGEVQTADANQSFMVEKEVDHLKWMAGLSSLFLFDEVGAVGVQTDDHKCGLGKWLYSSETESQAAEDPELNRLLESLKAPHSRLHASALDIDEKYIDFDLELEALLSDRWIDHLSWIKQLGSAVMSRKVFDGGVNPRECAFGKWYYSYSASGGKFGRLLKQWEAPHNRLHESAAAIVAAQKAGNHLKAQDLYQAETIPALEEIERSYRQTLVWIDSQSARQAEARALFDVKTKAALAETQASLSKVKQHFAEVARAASTNANADIDSTVSLLSYLVIVSLALGSIAAFFITRAITKPVSRVVSATEAMNHEFVELAGVLESIAGNDLTVQVCQAPIDIEAEESRDEIGRLVGAIKSTLASKRKMCESMDRMTTNLNGMIRQISDNAREVVSASAQIAAAAEEASRGAGDQSDQAGRVSTAMDQMTSAVVETSKHAEDASSASARAAETANQGGQVVADTISGMQRITEVVGDSARSIGKLASSADQIGEIITVIDDIADQTNLLALNAAIEAARAGEQGRGFAVVADEVRKLAERTGKATGEITDMIKGIQEETTGAVNSMESGMEEVGKGRELTDQAGNRLREVIEMSQQTREMIERIASAGAEQSAAAEEIARSVDNISAVSSAASNGAQESAAASEELNRNAENLRKMVSMFRIVGGNLGILQLAKEDHTRYMSRLKKVVDGETRATWWGHTDHTGCRFGKWYYGPGRNELGHLSDFGRIENVHIKVHQFANEAVEVLAAGDTAKARSLFGQAVSASHEVKDLIDSLRESANSEGVGPAVEDQGATPAV